MYEGIESLIECGWTIVYTYSNWDPGNALIFVPDIEDDWKSTAIESIVRLLDTDYEGSAIIDQYIKDQDLPLIVRGSFDKCIKTFEDNISDISESEKISRLSKSEETFKKFMLACIEIIRADDMGEIAIEKAANRKIGWMHYYNLSDLK